MGEKLEIVERLCLGLGGLLFAVEGLLKLAGVATLLGMTIPCGGSLLFIGVGALAHAARKH